MNELLTQHGDVSQVVAVTVICVNVALSATQKILGLVMDRTKTKIDNKAYVVVTNAMIYLAKVVDWASANRKHK
jgi:hypothetical protein